MVRRDEMPVRFEVAPVARPRMTQRDKWKGRPAVLKYFAYRDFVRLHAGPWRIGGQVWIRFVVPMPPSWSKKKRAEHAGKPHRQRPDLDNYIKGFLDCWEEDCYVWQVVATKLWALDGQPGYVEAHNVVSYVDPSPG